MLQKPAPTLTADRFPALLDALIELLESLSPAEWTLPAAGGWTVKDVALHLLGDEIGIISWRRDGFSTAPPSISSWDGLLEWGNQRNAAWVDASSRISPRLLCDLLRFTGDQANHLFASLDPLAPGGEVSWAAAGPAPTWLEIGREYTERWHHQQHIRDAAGRPGCATPYFLAPALQTFIHALPRTYQQVEAPPQTAVTLEISGPSGGVWTVIREENGWQIYLGRPDTPHAAVCLPEDAAWRLFTKGITRQQARDRAALSGSLALAETMLDTISIIA